MRSMGGLHGGGSIFREMGESNYMTSSKNTNPGSLFGSKGNSMMSNVIMPHRRRADYAVNPLSNVFMPGVRRADYAVNPLSGLGAPTFEQFQRANALQARWATIMARVSRLPQSSQDIFMAVANQTQIPRRVGQDFPKGEITDDRIKKSESRMPALEKLVQDLETRPTQEVIREVPQIVEVVRETTRDVPRDVVPTWVYVSGVAALGLIAYLALRK